MIAGGGLSRRRFLGATGGALAGLALAGCSGDGGGDGPGGIAKSGPVYRRINASITTLDPVAATDQASSYVVGQVFDTLMGYPDGHPEVEPQLAADYRVADGGRTYTFTLREATFHDGSAVTPDDVVYSLERLAASPNSRRRSFLLDVLGVTHETTTETRDGEAREVYAPGTLGVTAVDDRTVRIRLARPFVAALEMLAFGAFSVVPEGIVGDIAGYEGRLDYETFATSGPVGCGPFEFVSWEQGTECAVQRFDDYHGTVPSVAGVHWQVIEETDPSYTYAMNGNADTFAIPTPKYDPEKVSVTETTPKGIEVGTYGPVADGVTLSYSRRAQLGTFFLGFDMANVPKPVRQAFAHAVNQASLVTNVFKDRAQTAAHLVPPAIFPGGPTAYASHAEAYPYGLQSSDLEQARRVMESAGYGPADRFSLTWTGLPPSVWTAMGNVVRDQVASAHIDLTLETASFATLAQRARTGSLGVFTLGWFADYPAPQNFLHLLNPPETDTSKPNPVSFLNWSPETGDAAAEATEAWQRIVANSGPSADAARARAEAALVMEEANWEDVGYLTFLHPVGEQFSYDWVDIEPYGAMGPTNQKFNEVRIGERE